MILGSSNNTYAGGTTVQAGTLVTASNFSNGTLNIATATAAVQHQSTNNSAAGSTFVPGLQIAGGGHLDLNNNALILDYSGATKLPSIATLIRTGAITSTPAQTIGADKTQLHKTALGYAEASSIGHASGTFAGRPMDGTDILVAYTLLGDTNLDGAVNTQDFMAMAASFGSSGKFWQNGDFNGDGVVNALDFNMIATNFGAPIPTTTSASDPLGASVPEPCLGLAMASLIVPRRRSPRYAGPTNSGA